MSVLKKTKVVMLPTNQKAIMGFLTRKGKERNDLRFFGREMSNILDSENQHLYFLSDEEPKNGDYTIFNTYDNNNSLVKQEVIKFNGGFGKFKKIIATTDSSLTLVDEFNNHYDLLPEPSQSFIEKYIEKYDKGKQITEVMVEYELNEGLAISQIHEGIDKVPTAYLPKVNPKDSTITIKPVKNSWNKEEIKILFDRYNEFIAHHDIEEWNQWIDKNLF